MNEQEQIGWKTAELEFKAGRTRSAYTYNQLSRDAATAYDEHWSQIEKYQAQENA